MIAAFEWGCGKEFANYLLASVCPHVKQIPIEPIESWQRCLRAVDGCRFVIPHLDCSVTRNFTVCKTQNIKELRKKGVYVLNHSITDISKRTLHRLLAKSSLQSIAANRSGELGEQLIVKSNLNCGGIVERSLKDEELSDLEIPKPSGILRDQHSYKVLCRRDIPDQWWDDPTLAIERFIRNVDDVIVRVYKFFEHLVVTEAINPNLIKKMDHGIPRTNHFFALASGECVPADGRIRVEHLNLLRTIESFLRVVQLDFGSIDIVRDDSFRYYVIDLNLTPYWFDNQDGLIEHLMMGRGI